MNEVGGRQVAALQRHGVVWVTGRALSPAVVGSAFDVARGFFELPREEKDRVRGPERGFWRGYQPVLPSEALERFEVGPVYPPADGYRLSARFAGGGVGGWWSQTTGACERQAVPLKAPPRQPRRGSR